MYEKLKPINTVALGNAGACNSDLDTFARKYGASEVPNFDEFIEEARARGWIGFLLDNGFIRRVTVVHNRGDKFSRRVNGVERTYVLMISSRGCKEDQNFQAALVNVSTGEPVVGLVKVASDKGVTAAEFKKICGNAKRKRFTFAKLNM